MGDPCSSGYEAIPPTETSEEGVRLRDATLRLVTARPPVTTGTGERGMCLCVHLFPEDSAWIPLWHLHDILKIYLKIYCF